MDFRVPDFDLIATATIPPTSIPYGVKMIASELEWPETMGGRN